LPLLHQQLDFRSEQHGFLRGDRVVHEKIPVVMSFSSCYPQEGFVKSDSRLEKVPRGLRVGYNSGIFSLS
jgi:hypothetical protein